MMPLIFAGLLVGCDPEPIQSYLFQPSYCIDECRRHPARPYEPQPGDLMFATDDKVFWKIMHNLAGTGHPHHSGIVFRRSDGRLAVLEGGPYDTLFIGTIDALPHLKEYEKYGPIWIRQRKAPLTEGQSACLTAFAEGADGKRFALGRLAVQLTPFRTRGPIRTRWVGWPQGDRRSYFCAELVLEALVAAGVLCPNTTRPSATFPRDMFIDQSLNPFIDQNLRLEHCWHPPSLWTSCLEHPVPREKPKGPFGR
jgi:hypothetical protein